MAKVLFKRKTTDEIKDLEVEDGALIYNTDNGKTYMDFGEDRIQTGGNADTMIAIGGVEAPTDTDIKIWFPDDTINTKASEVVNSMDGNETDIAPSVNAVKNYVKEKTNIEVLGWTNPNPTSLFGAETITLIDDVSNYESYEVLYKGWRANPHMLTTGRIPVEWGAILSYYESTSVLGMRIMNKPNGKNMTFGNMTGNGVDNNYVVPYQVKLYKEVSE